MKNYYNLLMLQPKATSVEVEASFRRVIARYRPTLTVEQLFADPRFIERVNAYLTLKSPQRPQYDELLKRAATEEAKPPTPLTHFSPTDTQIFMARIASWRREPIEAIHLLRSLLQKEPGHAAGWAMLGEVYFIVDRLEDGIQAYQNAVQAEPKNTTFSTRMQQAKDALVGKGRLKIELSPEEELLREERRKRWRVATAIMLIGAALIAYSFFPHRQFEGAFYVPWISVGIQALGVFALFIGLGFGRIMQPFERVMLWSSMPAGDRGTVKSYPYGLILFVTAVPSLWLALLVLGIMAAMDEEWPTSPSIMLGVCLLLTLALTYVVYCAFGHQNWVPTLIIGGNASVIAAMLGWWMGSFNTPEYD